MNSESNPLSLYGSSISYFTGKLENYFRIKGIAYRLEPMTAQGRKEVKANTGSAQMPALRLPDGRWMSDSTPIIQWFEDAHAHPPVIPVKPLQRFFSLLLEDYADEWLWRPAMHFRWHYTEGARWASTHLAAEVMPDVPLPVFLKRLVIIRRQRQGYTVGDGITADQVAGVEAVYFRALDALQAILESRPFLLGQSPSLADIGFSGPFFRHFGLDPVPAEILRQRAPAVWEWAARLWNSRPQEPTWLEGVPEDWGPLLGDIGSAYLPYLCDNVDAVAADQARFDSDAGGVSYRGARASRYRVWCLQKLRDHFEALPPADQEAARSLLEAHGCWEPLWRHSQLPLAEDFCQRLPFHADAKMLEVYD